MHIQTEFKTFTIYSIPHTTLQITLVDREPLLLDSSLWENLVFGKKEVDEETVWKVAEGLGMSRALLDNPNRKELKVGDCGCNLRLADKQVSFIGCILIKPLDDVALILLVGDFNCACCDWRPQCSPAPQSGQSFY